MVSLTFGNTSEPPADMPFHAIRELLRPRYTLYVQRLQYRLKYIRVGFFFWGCTSLTLALPGSLESLYTSWDCGARTALTAYLALSSGMELMAVMSSEWGGWLTPAQSAWLWPPGQAGEVSFVVVHACYFKIKNLGHAL